MTPTLFDVLDRVPMARRDQPVSRACAAAYAGDGARMRHVDLVLSALRDGPKRSSELRGITHRFGARIFELKAAGHAITTTPGRDPVYTLKDSTP